MCGIFGGIGKVDPAIIRALAIANRERGTDSLGFFDSRMRMEKAAGDPMDLLPAMNDFILEACKGWFVAGHTRLATRGAKTDRNAHPFQYGLVVGSHNGVVQAPNRYEVDSEYLIDLLDLNTNYQTALEKVPGYWGLSWFDGRYFYLMAHDIDIGLGLLNGAWYYSSDWLHLEAACGEVQELHILDKGCVLRFQGVEFEALEDFQSEVYHRKYAVKSWQNARYLEELEYLERDRTCWDGDDYRQAWGAYVDDDNIRMIK